MGKYGGASFAVLLVDGRSLLSVAVKSFTHKIESKLEDATGLGDSFASMLPTGLSKVTLTQDGAFFDDTTSGYHALFSGGSVSSRTLCYALAGNTIGQPFAGTYGTYQQSYAVQGASGALTKANVAYQMAGQVDRGTILQPLAAQTATWNTKSSSVDYTVDPSQTVIPITSNTAANPSVVTTTVPHGLTTGDVILISGVSTSSPTINGARTVTVTGASTFTVAVNVTVPGTGGSFVRGSTSGGAAGYLHVTAASGFTNFVGKIQHSTDNASWSDLITFTDNVSAPFAERLTVAGTVNRYLSFTGTLTGSGSLTAFIGLGRL